MVSKFLDMCAGYSSSIYDSSKASKFISILKDIYMSTVESGKEAKVCIGSHNPRALDK